jgi:predicted Rossmann fold nucleotide-binding protein DprA/Smf involved in DNA uptake
VQAVAIVGSRRPRCGGEAAAFAFNTNRANNILAAQGFLASEYPPRPAGEACRAANLRLVDSNKILAALSLEGAQL